MKTFPLKAVYAVLVLLACLPLHGEEPKKQFATSPEVKKADDAKPAAGQAVAKPEFTFHVVDSQGRPVARANVSAEYYVYRNVVNFTVKFESHDIAPAITDADGLAKLVFGADANQANGSALKRLLVYGYVRLGIKVDHPDHPICRAVIDPHADGFVALADANRIEIRAHRSGETAVARRIYPVLSTGLDDWSDAPDGTVTIRRVELRGEQPASWLRVVQPGEQGEAWFSEVIGLLPQSGGVVKVDAELKRGVRVEGGLDPRVPRPVKNGRVVARISQSTAGATKISYWEAASDIAPDGNFVFESLPAGELMEGTAMCDGWVSANPSNDDLAANIKRFDDGSRILRPWIESFVCAQVFPVSAETVAPTIVMQRCATCEVTVLDENGQPVPDARVNFSYQPGWFYGIGIRDAGNGIDELTTIRNRLKAREHKELGFTRGSATQASVAKYTAITNVQGIAIVANLPAGPETTNGVGLDKTFYVSCAGYAVTPNPPNPNDPPEMQPSVVHVKPGETSRVTVHMHNAPERAN